ncbi:Tannase and feruloyl esterase [Neorhizobium galegae bv. officinalis]|nr:Tannase and feruloyl esterase [Neorhizobium galegae bv. officinalis]
MRKTIYLIALAGLTQLAWHSPADAGVECENLQAKTDSVGITISESAKTSPTNDIPVGHCLVRGIVGARKGTDGVSYGIRFELRLPDQWNGRYVHQFNGGNDGTVVPAVGPLLGGNKQDTALARGYAVVSSDAGHDGKANPDRGLAAGAAFGFDPEARRDYGYGAVAKLNPIAVNLVETYYGKKIAFSYGVGGSNGGRHGLMAATRMPNDFDGILAGYPGFNLPRAALQHALDIQSWAKVNSDISKALSREDMATLAKGILAACDASDGLTDGIVGDPDSCETLFKPQALQCPNGRTDDCLSEAQVTALLASRAGPRGPKDEQLYSAWAWDPGMASANWRGWKLESAVDSWGRRPTIGVMGAASLAQIFTTPPTSVGGTPEELQKFLLEFDIKSESSKIFAKDGVMTESAVEFMIPPRSDNPDLKDFREAGHKMIVFHGNADPVFSVLDTVNWYQKLDANNKGAAQSFVKFYRIPGMPHGAGGPSYDDFDFFSPLVDWVEKGTAPQAVSAGITQKNGEAKALVGVRYLYCPYPQVSRVKTSSTGEKERACQ